MQTLHNKPTRFSFYCTMVLLFVMIEIAYCSYKAQLGKVYSTILFMCVCVCV